MSETIYEICLGIGSNIQPELNIPKAMRLIEAAVSIVAISSIWETHAEGSPGPNFLNATALVRTNWPPERLKCDLLRKVEAQLGRVRSTDKNAPRPIDLDILVVDGQVIDPQVWEKVYLAVPVAELLPDLKSPDGVPLAKIASRLGAIIDIQNHPLPSGALAGIPSIESSRQ